MRVREIVVLALVVCCSASFAVAVEPGQRPPPLSSVAPPPQSSGEIKAAAATQALLRHDYKAGVQAMDEAWRMGFRRADDAYNAACGASLLGNPDDALKWLERAVDAGFIDAAGAEADSDLAPLRSRPAFAALTKRMRAGTGQSSELERLAQADQEERAHIAALPASQRQPGKLEARDRGRRRRADALLKAIASPTANELYAAALIFQHGETLDDYRRARDYALAAARLGHANARWLVAAAWDRWLVAAGYPQRFGTQTVCRPECDLAPIDPTVTDAERAAWNVQPLRELRSQRNP